MAVSAEPAEGRLSFSVLGPLVVTDGDRQLRPGGAKARTLLALLVSRCGHVSPDPGLTSVLHETVPLNQGP